MNKRKEAKKNTKDAILRTSKHLFSQKGFINTQTSEIARTAGIAHGTLFLHYKTKELLLLEVIEDMLIDITDSLHLLLDNSYSFSDLLTIYLDVIEKEEAFFHNLYKELPFYKDDLRRKITFLETGIRKYFYETLERGMSEEQVKKTNIPTLLNIIFGTIQYYLVNKATFSGNENVISRHKKHIHETITNLIGG